MNYTVTQNNVHIENSYQVRPRSLMKDWLKLIKSEYPNSDVWQRSMWSLTSEWKTHNRLYRLGLWKDRTASVDLDFPQKWYYKVAYFILGL